METQTNSDSATPSTLRAESIDKHFPTRSGPLVVLRNVSLFLTAGESAAITGPSGSGKSTLLNILGTLEPPSAGSLRIGQCDPFALSDPELARFRNRQIGFVFQDHHLLPQCSVLENVLIPTLAAEGRKDAAVRARVLLDRVGLTDRLDHRPAELSGGQKQRVAVARALVNRPTLLLADEPTGNLDRQTADTVAGLLLDLHLQENTILIVVTHSLTLAKRFTRQYELVDAGLREM